GDWLLIQTSRFGCGVDMCLAVVSGSLCDAQVIVTDGDVIHPASHSAINATGDLAIYTDNKGPHTIDLFAVHRIGSAWSSPLLLTKDSTDPFHFYPTISWDGKK